MILTTQYKHGDRVLCIIGRGICRGTIIAVHAHADCDGVRIRYDITPDGNGSCFTTIEEMEVFASIDSVLKHLRYDLQEKDKKAAFERKEIEELQAEINR